MAKPSVVTLASEQCANNVAGRCAGVDFRLQDDGTLEHRAAPLDTCMVKKHFRCAYFERVVLPLASSVADYAGLDAQYRLSNAMSDPDKADDELRRHPFFVSGPRVVKADSGYTCSSCGGPRQKGRRYCPKCAKDHTRRSWQIAAKRKRGHELAAS